MKPLLTACLVLLACGRPIVSTCRSGPFTVDGEVPLDCRAVDRGVDLARQLYGGVPRDVLRIPDEQGSSFEDPWFSPRKSFDEAFAGTNVQVLEGESVDCGTIFEDKHAGGCMKEGNILLPSLQQISFGHEIMHVYECRVDGNCWNTKHVDWATSGMTNYGVAYNYGVTDGGLFAATLLPEYQWTK